MLLAKKTKIEGYRLFWESISDPLSCGYTIMLEKSKRLAQTNADIKNAYESRKPQLDRHHYWIEPVYDELED